MTTANADLAALIRTIPISQARHPVPRYHHSAARRQGLPRLDRVAGGFAPAGIDLVAGIEARGFIFSSAAATQLGKGLLLIRKDGKLPGATIGVDYALEYGTDRVVMHEDACVPGQKVLLVDDLIATGGTALAAVRLLRQAGAVVVGASFVIDLPDLGGAEKLRAVGRAGDDAFELRGGLIRHRFSVVSVDDIRETIPPRRQLPQWSTAPARRRFQGRRSGPARRVRDHDSHPLGEGGAMDFSQSTRRGVLLLMAGASSHCRGTAAPRSFPAKGFR